jgi:RecB family exonuclease
VKTSPKLWRVYSGADGESHVAELPLDLKPFVDVEGAHGQTSPMQTATGIVFRVAPPGYVLDWHCAPRRQYSISLSGTAEIEVGDGTIVRGRIDAVYERDGVLELVDFKTGRPAAEGDGSAGVQLDLYGLAAIDTWKADPARLRTTYCWLRADGPPVVESCDWTPATVERVRAELTDTLDRLRAGVFRPTPGGWCTHCDFLSVCPAGQARQ